MINTKIVRNSDLPAEERVIKLLEGIDWKLWEIYNMLKKEADSKLDRKEKN